MRFADRPSTEVSIEILAAPDVVWPFVTDVRLHARWSAELQAAEWVDPDPAPRVGSRFRGRNRNEHMGDWETISTVTVHDQPRAYGWVVNDPVNPAASWLFTLEPIVAGTLLRYRVELGPGPSGLTAAIAARPDREERIVLSRLGDLRSGMLATIAGVKSVAEGRR